MTKPEACRKWRSTKAIHTASMALLAVFLSTAAEANSDLSKEQRDKILQSLAPMGCTEIRGEGEDEGTHFEVDDIICNGYSYDVQIDKDMRIITMVRDPGKK